LWRSQWYCEIWLFLEIEKYQISNISTSRPRFFLGLEKFQTLKIGFKLEEKHSQKNMIVGRSTIQI